MSRSKDIGAVLLALALLTSMTACASTPSSPSSAKDAYGVMVDIFSGRENPKAGLSSGVAEQIYGELDGRSAEFQTAAEPAAALGFRGFVITAAGDDAKPVLRVLKDSVYSIRGGAHQKLPDPSGKYYTLVLNDVKPKLSQEVVSALP